MANLVTPVQKLTPYEERIIEFKGLNRKSSVEEGEMSDMQNLTSSNYPLLTPRKLRGELTLPDGVAKPLKIMVKYERIAMIAQKEDDSIAFFYDGEEVTSVTGLTADTEMVAINTKICFFPQKTYLSIERNSTEVTIHEYGQLEATSELTSAAMNITNSDVQLTLPAGHGFKKGDAIDIAGTVEINSNTVYTSDGTKKRVCTQPDGTGGDILVPAGVKFCALKRSDSSMLYLVAASDSPFVLESYKQNDGSLEDRYVAKLRNGHYVCNQRWYSPAPTPVISYSTISASADPQLVGMHMIFPSAVNVSCAVNDVNGNVLVLPRESFIELTGDGVTSIALTGTVKREMPDLKHVIEWNNRLWGASDSDNTIYACKLGDPTNWKYYQGTSLDAYYAQQGTDENWTGSAAYSGHLIFFKQNSMTKIYGTSPSSFQITNTVCYGVEEGSSNSVAIVNDKVFYKSSIGIMAYEGGTPYAISDKFNVKFKNVVGGTEGIKYYASIEKDDGTYELMVLDIDKAVWHKEDSVRFRDCCTLDGRLYFIEDSESGIFEADRIYIINPETATEKSYQRKWVAVFGPFDEYLEDQKIYSKMSLRFISQPGTKVNVYIKMDDGEWETVKKFEYASTGGELVPIVPRRCDRFSIKIAGTGDCEIKSLTRRYRRGSGVKNDHSVR